MKMTGFFVPPYIRHNDQYQQSSGVARSKLSHQPSWTAGAKPGVR